jgi:hypothetical protein
MILHVLPENYTIAKLEDFQVKMPDGKTTFNIGMKFIIRSLTTKDAPFEAYTINQSWNVSGKGLNKLSQIWYFIEGKSCWVNSGKKIDKEVVLPPAPAIPKPLDYDENEILF